MKIKNLLKPALIGSAIMCSLNSYGAFIPMPIIMHSGGGGGSLSNKEGIAFLIALNIPMILIFLIRSLIWFYKKERENYSYVEYTLWSEFEYVTPDINTICFLTTNGIGVIIAIAIWLTSIL